MENRKILQATLSVSLLIASVHGEHLYSGQVLKMDQAVVTFHNKLSEGVDVYYTSDYCYKCLYQPLVSIKNSNNNASAVVSTKFTLTIQVEAQARNATLCRWSETYEEGGHYSVWIHLSDSFSPTCSYSLDKSPRIPYLRIPYDFVWVTERRRGVRQPMIWKETLGVFIIPLIPALVVAALLLALITLLFVVAPFIYRRHCTTKFIKTICCQGPQYPEDSDEAYVCEAEDARNVKPKHTRLRSLDTFRGFALTVMVFVNYGGGGYWFFQHAPWNGLTVADLVMPWFVFIIGTSVVLAFKSMQRKNVGRVQMLRKLTWRTVVLILLGFCFLNYSPRDGPLSWSWLRIPGVLQRLGFTYFVLSLMQTFWGRKEIPVKGHHWWNPVQDVVLYWPEWLFIILLETIWLCITFLMPIPNCPKGYLGAGGIGDNGAYPNCTGGAAGYIDRVMFGDNMYRYPTCREMYQTTQPFDPEGILGTINSIVMGFMGMQAGKIMIFFKGANKHILARFLVWAVILGISAAILSKCTRDEGFIPVNKNLWSLSYVMCMGCFSFLLLAGMYFVMDIKEWWGGQPFKYPGMNSILVYVGHSLLGFYFPFSWEMRFQESHWEWLFQGLWGTSLWVLIAYLLYRKKLFLKI